MSVFLITSRLLIIICSLDTHNIAILNEDYNRIYFKLPIANLVVKCFISIKCLLRFYDMLKNGQFCQHFHLTNEELWFNKIYSGKMKMAKQILHQPEVVLCLPPFFYKIET